MKPLFITFLILIFLLPGCQCDSETAKETSSKITKKVIEIGKGTISGIEKGIKEGKKTTKGLDGALIVDNLQQMKKSLEIEVLSVKKGIFENTVEVELSLEEKARLELQENAINLAKEKPQEVAALLKTWLAEE